MHGTGMSIIRLLTVALWVGLFLFVLRVSAGVLWKVWTNPITAGMYGILGGNPYSGTNNVTKAA